MSQENPKPKRKGKRLITIFLILFVGLGGYFWLTSARVVEKSVELDYGPTDPAFLSTMGAVLGAEFTGGNAFKALSDGDEIFASMLEAIRGAQKSITMEMYIWGPGKVSDQFLAALTERAKAGVKVHVLVDGMGSLKLNAKDYEPLTEAGGEFVNYGRRHWWEIKANINHRTHRKILVVDGRVGFTGGMCIDDKWLGRAESMEVWHDLGVRMEGPGVRQMQATFIANWTQTTGEILVGEEYFPTLKPVGDIPAQIIRSGPDESAENARKAFLLAIASARRSIKLGHAYFVPDDLATEMLLAARKRGVRIEVIIPEKNDSRFGRAASRSRWGPLMDAGFEFHRYQPALYHNKVMIVDDAFVTLGSVNFDNRSFAINDEMNVNFIGGAAARDQVELFAADLKKSRPYTREEFDSRPWLQKRLDWFCGLFRSQL